MLRWLVALGVALLLAFLGGPVFAQTVNQSVCNGACTLTFDLSALDVLNIDPAGGALIAGSILAVWAVGYGFRVVLRAMNIDGVSPTSESEK